MKQDCQLLLRIVLRWTRQVELNVLNLSVNASRPHNLATNRNYDEWMPRTGTCKTSVQQYNEINFYMQRYVKLKFFIFEYEYIYLLYLKQNNFIQLRVLLF